MSERVYSVAYDKSVYESASQCNLHETNVPSHHTQQRVRMSARWEVRMEKALCSLPTV